MSNGMAFLDVPQIRPPTLCYSLHAFDPTVLILPLGKLLLLTTKSRMLPETVTVLPRKIPSARSSP